VLVAALAFAGASGAEDATSLPLTAIPWLSDSIETSAPEDPAQAPRARPRPPEVATVGTITVTPLEGTRRDAVGLIAPATSGLPRALWGDTIAPAARDLILEHPEGALPAARALFRLLLLAEADPPPGSGPDAGLLLARVDRLLAMGALEDAEALILAAGPETPDLFRRWFDIGLLTGRAQPQCTALRRNPALSPTLPARVFCLARGGDWNAAEITLTLGEGVGAIRPEQERLLARFLDPVLFEGEPDPPVPEPLTAIDFVLREAVGLPRPPGRLPLAFLRADLDEHAPMRMRIDAAERLVLANAEPEATLFAAYRAGTPAASGGVWDRARAVQALDAALASGDAAALAAALSEADRALSARGLRVALAREYGPALAGRTDMLPEQGIAERLFELLLLAGERDAAAMITGSDPRRAVLLAIGDPARPLPEPPEEARLAAALDGLTDRLPRDARETRLAGLVLTGRSGEALLAALALVAEGPNTDPAALAAALLTLRAAGQDAAARAIALEALLLPPRA